MHGVVQRVFEVCGLDEAFAMRSSLYDIGMGSVVTRRVTLESRSLSEGLGLA